MLERHLHFARVDRPPAEETAASARVRLGDKFPRGSLRRMTHLGMLVGSALDGLPVSPEDALVYATAYAETCALEDFLGSFPDASPLWFQTSIYPGAVQQVMIGRRQPITRFWPMTGRRRLLEQALLAALMEPAPRVVIVGGEERGTWMLDHGMGSERSFAFALGLTRGAAGTLGRVAFRPGDPAAPAPADGPCPGLDAWTDSIAERRSLEWAGMGGTWTLDWA